MNSLYDMSIERALVVIGDLKILFQEPESILHVSSSSVPCAHLAGCCPAAVEKHSCRVAREITYPISQEAFFRDFGPFSELVLT